MGYANPIVGRIAPERHGLITRADMVPIYRRERERRFAGHAAATTMFIVAGLAEPDLLVEIQAVAARHEDMR